jgi:HlyD family secretion protein
MTNRDRAVIRSPVSGVVLARQVEPGQTVAASFNTPTLFVIAEDLSAMQLRVSIDEADVGQVKQGQRRPSRSMPIPGARSRRRSSASRWPRTTPPPRPSSSSRGSKATR